MKKLTWKTNYKNILLAIITTFLIISIVIGITAIRINIAREEYGSSNNASSNANLIPEISFEPNGNTTWLSSQSTEVTVSDNLTNSCVLLLMPVFEKYWYS